MGTKKCDVDMKDVCVVTHLTPYMYLFLVRGGCLLTSGCAVTLWRLDGGHIYTIVSEISNMLEIPKRM